MINRDEDFRFWRQFSHYDLSLRVAELHRQRRELCERVAGSEVETARRTIANAYLTGRGIEVGAGARPVPVPEHAIVSYGDIREGDDLRQYFRDVTNPQLPEGQLIDAQTFAGVADASLDFVITAHVIEHLVDPVGSIANALRVLKPRGRYLLIVPDMAHTFDKDRPETALEHVLADYHDGGSGTLRQAYWEHYSFVHPVLTGERLDPQDIENRILQSIEARLEIHFHAWTGKGFRQMLDAVSDALEFVVLCHTFCGNENIFVLERRPRSKHDCSRLIMGPKPQKHTTAAMHQSSLQHVQALLSRYPVRAGVLADVGSTDVNGTYRPLFPGWRYIGIDTAPGPGVDVVARNPYRYPLPSASVDLVVCGQVFEHMEYFWLGWLDMCRIVKPSGLIFLLAPSRGPEHRYPADCWRFYPDGFGALAKWAGVELLEVSTDWAEDPDPGSGVWGDTVGVFRRYPESAAGRLRRYLLRQSCNFFGPRSW